MKKITLLLSVFLFTSILFEVHSADMSRIKGLSCSYLIDHHYTVHPQKTIGDMLEGEKQKIKMHTIITDIDQSKGTAKMIGNNRTVDVQVFMSGIGLVFLEITDIAIHTYVVYNTKILGMEKDDGQFPTIQSRNALLFINGIGVSSQLAGMCVAVTP